MELTDYLYENIDKGCYIHCAFIDYSKAFDTLDHNILFMKLNNLGIGKNVLNWCKSYLTGRSQYVKLNNNTSTCLPILCGVPQGSILGPLYFVIYVNDLLEKFIGNCVQITLYADDTVLYVSHECPRRTSDLLNEGLHLLSQWCQESKLTINVKKTKHRIISPPRTYRE